ncbi:MAG: hypothetical protein WBA93_07635, partial [Microcoleaceae cyanobacterium]
ETKRITGITDKQLTKLVENAQKVDVEKRKVKAQNEKGLIKSGSFGCLPSKSSLALVSSDAP